MATEGVTETWIYGGEVWTDARGQAIVLLPDHVHALSSAFSYELEPDAPDVRACVALELRDHRFTIETDRPHAKVRWRVLATGIDRRRRRF
jgi:hypothetical protein